MAVRISSPPVLWMAEVGLAAGRAGAPHELHLRHPEALERHEGELDERVTRELLDPPEHRPARGIAVALDGLHHVLLEAGEVGAEEPIGRRDAATRREAEARPLAELTAP